MLVAGSEGAAIHPAAAAREGEPIVVKHRVSPFVGTDLVTRCKIPLRLVVNLSEATFVDLMGEEVLLWLARIGGGLLLRTVIASMSANACICRWHRNAPGLSPGRCNAFADVFWTFADLATQTRNERVRSAMRTSTDTVATSVSHRFAVMDREKAPFPTLSGGVCTSN
jgi:hypothetical protein